MKQGTNMEQRAVKNHIRVRLDNFFLLQIIKKMLPKVSRWDEDSILLNDDTTSISIG